MVVDEAVVVDEAEETQNFCISLYIPDNMELSNLDRFHHHYLFHCIEKCLDQMRTYHKNHFHNIYRVKNLHQPRGVGRGSRNNVVLAWYVLEGKRAFVIRRVNQGFGTPRKSIILIKRLIRITSIPSKVPLVSSFKTFILKASAPYNCPLLSGHIFFPCIFNSYK